MHMHMYIFIYRRGFAKFTEMIKKRQVYFGTKHLKIQGSSEQNVYYEKALYGFEVFLQSKFISSFNFP